MPFFVRYATAYSLVQTSNPTDTVFNNDFVASDSQSQGGSDATSGRELADPVDWTLRCRVRRASHWILGGNLFTVLYVRGNH